MKKIKGTILAILMGMLVLPAAVKAASASISISTSGTAVVGNTITATVSLSGSDIGSWQFLINHSGNLSLVSGQEAVTDTYASHGKSYTLKYKVLRSGSASINVGSYLVYAMDESQMSVSTRNASIRCMTQAELEATYSKNNNLKGLSIEGYDITPEFNKDTLEYEATVPSTVDKVNIIATKEDNTASVEGDGEREVKEGPNSFDIVVTAQNGTSKTYKLVVTVEDINPIEVVLNGTTYNVIKRADTIEKKPVGFEETTIKIGEFDIPAFKSESLNLTLVGIRDEDGNIRFAIYEDDEYTLYNEITTGSLTVYLLSLKELKDYEKYKVEINGVETEAYKYSKNSDFAIVYAKNVETGEEGFYVYDLKDQTIQRYDEETFKALQKKLKLDLYVMCALEGVLGLIILVFIISKVSKNKKKKKHNIDDSKKETETKKEEVIDSKKEEINSKEMEKMIEGVEYNFLGEKIKKKKTK